MTSKGRLERVYTCSICYVEYVAKRHSILKYCSDTCRKVASKMKKCIHCKTKFVKSDSRSPDFCCMECRHSFHVEHKDNHKIRTKHDATYAKHVEDFLNTTSFAEGTIFIPSKDKKLYYIVECPVCNDGGETKIQYLRDGRKPCACSPARQTQAYVNLIKDEENILAIKFGIAVSSNNRIKDQKRVTIYDMDNFAIYEFNTRKDCYAAEKECKQTLHCGIISKEEMRDGYTETTYPYNIEKIIEIYEKHGGVRVDKTCRTA